MIEKIEDWRMGQRVFKAVGTACRKTMDLVFGGKGFRMAMCKVCLKLRKAWRWKC